MVMRRFDFWVGRIAAIAGIAYVLLASLWPLAASAGEEGAPATSQGFAVHDDAIIAMLPVEAALIDLRIGRVIAEVIALRERDEAKRGRRTRRRSCPAFPSDGNCDELSSQPPRPDSSTTIVLLIPMGALACAAATTLSGRGMKAS